MSNYIHNLDRESLLMLYLAGELPAEDHAEVEAMIAADAALRAQYEQMQREHQSMTVAFAGADAHSPLPAPESSSLRRVGSAMKQWQVDRLVRPASTPVRARRKFGWLYATAASLLIVIGTVFFLWSRVDDGKSQLAIFPDDNTSKTDQQPTNTTDEGPAEDPIAGDYTPGGAPSDIQLSRAEADLSTVSVLSDSLRQNEDAVSP